MPVAVQQARNVQMVRDRSYFGLNKDKNHKKSKSVPWVDVSDEEDKSKTTGHKRKAPTSNGRHETSHNDHTSKKRRHEFHKNDSHQPNGDSTGAGPSLSPTGDHLNGNHSSAKAKAIQEQRRDLPIAKGIIVGPSVLIYSLVD